ncbi:putative 1,3-beta-glucan synthase [Helianthus annuus]|nr:putative 1,3-beta-glucan synthase [Helianthus annuus]
MEVALLLIVYIAYGYSQGGVVSYVLLTLSSWFLVISWLFAPYIFNASGFEWQKTVEDFNDWINWLLYKGGVGMYGLSWVVLAGFVIIFKIFTFNSKKSGFQLFLRFIQGVIALCPIAVVILFIILTDLSVPDLFSSFLAFVATVGDATERNCEELGLWESVREFARMYDTGMGILIFAPIAMLSWFPICLHIPVLSSV